MAVNALEEKGAAFTIVEYLKEPFTAASLTEVLKQLNIPAEELIRKGEKDFKENFKGMTLSEDEWVEAMIHYPKLIERPIVVLDGKAVVARPTERIEELG